MTWSIRARLTLWYSVVVVAVLVSGLIAVAFAQAELGLVRLDGELRRMMLTLQGVMRTEFNEGLDLRAAADEASSEVVAPDMTLMLVGPDGTVLAVWGYALPEAWLPRTGVASAPETLSIRGQRFRALHEPVEHAGHRYVAAVVAPLEGLDREHAELLLALAVGAFVSLVLAVVGGWVVGRQTLKPLADMAEQATSISDRELSTRLRARSANDELGRLGAAFNALLDRLAAALRSQRQFMADASHEMRTPVSIIRTTAQVTLQREPRRESEYRESLAIVVEQSGRLASLVEAMLLLSRAEANGMPLVREPLYLDELVLECVRAARVLSDARGLHVRVTTETEVALVGDDALLRRMVGNLLDNAIRHARAGGSVAVVLERSSDSFSLRVTDDGAGVPTGEEERIFERFVRLVPGAGGAGLGLPIARWIAEQHGGRLVLERVAEDGTCFRVTLPLPAALDAVDPVLPKGSLPLSSSVH